MPPERTPIANLHLTVLNKLGIQQEKFGDSTGLSREFDCSRNFPLNRRNVLSALGLGARRHALIGWRLAAGGREDSSPPRH